jgi:hypothetical protein
MSLNSSTPESHTRPSIRLRHKPQMSLNSSTVPPQTPVQFVCPTPVFGITQHTHTTLHKIYIMHRYFTQHIQTVNSKFLQSIKSFKIIARLLRLI